MSAQAVGAARGDLYRPAADRIVLSRRRALVVAYLVSLLPALVMAFVQPVWQLTDEAQHYDVIAQYAHGAYPIEGRSTLRPETAAIMRQTGIYRWSPAESLPAPVTVDPGRFTTVPDYLHGYALTLWIRRHIWWFSYEAMQPPLYYVAAAPLWLAAAHSGGLLAAVYAERVLNCFLLALLAPLALATAWLLAPGRRWFAATAVIVTAALPGLLLNGTQVTNDTLGAVLGCTLIYLAARWAAEIWTWRRATVLGLLCGLTLLSKLTAFGIVVGLAAAWAWPLLRDRSRWGAQLARGAVGAAVAILAVLPWLVANWLTQHELVPSREAGLLLGAGTSTGHYNFGQDLAYLYTTFWTGEHEWSLPLTGLEATAILPFALAATVGIQRLVRRTAPAPGPAVVLWVLLAAIAGQTVWALAVPYLTHLGGMTPGRYLYPAVVPAIVLVLAGLGVLVRRPAARVALVAAFTLLTAVNVAGYAAGYTAVRHVNRQGPPPAAAARDVWGTGEFAGVTIAVDRLIDDRRSRWVWLHLEVANTSSRPADWWPGPAVDINDGNGWRVRGDFAASTPFPETLAPGAHFAGWVRMLVTPQQLAGRDRLQLDFEDVAADGYRKVGHIPIELRLD